MPEKNCYEGHLERRTLMLYTGLKLSGSGVRAAGGRLPLDGFWLALLHSKTVQTMRAIGWTVKAYRAAVEWSPTERLFIDLVS